MFLELGARLDQEIDVVLPCEIFLFLSDIRSSSLAEAGQLSSLITPGFVPQYP